MKYIFLTIMLLLSIPILKAQTNAEKSIITFEELRDEAAKLEDYEMAAKYQEAIDLKKKINDSASDGDYAEAARLKKKLNSISFNNSDTNEKEETKKADLDETSQDKETDKYSNSSDKYFSNSRILKNGIYLDAILGAGPYLAIGSVNRYAISGGMGGLGLRFGSRWYFGNATFYKAGFQVSWFRIDLDVAFINDGPALRLFPLNVGYASILNIDNKIAIEANLDLGFGLVGFMVSGGTATGLHINPQIKFRYKRLALGLDLSLVYGAGYSNIIGLSIGGKF